MKNHFVEEPQKEFFKPIYRQPEVE